MERKNFIRAVELDNQIAKLTLLAEATLQKAKRLNSFEGSAKITSLKCPWGEAFYVEEEAIHHLSNFYDKRHNDIQKELEKLKNEFLTL